METFEVLIEAARAIVDGGERPVSIGVTGGTDRVHRRPGRSGSG